MSEEPIIDLQSDDYFMGEALRQAVRAYEAEEVPVGAVSGLPPEGVMGLCRNRTVGIMS